MSVGGCVGIWRKGQPYVDKGKSCLIFSDLLGFFFLEQIRKWVSATQYNVVGYTLMKGKKLIRGVLANVKEKIAEWQKMVCFYWGVINKGA